MARRTWHNFSNVVPKSVLSRTDDGSEVRVAIDGNQFADGQVTRHVYVAGIKNEELWMTLDQARKLARMLAEAADEADALAEQEGLTYREACRRGLVLVDANADDYGTVGEQA
jgi:hypothetical protein